MCVLRITYYISFVNIHQYTTSFGMAEWFGSTKYWTHTEFGGLFNRSGFIHENEYVQN